MTAEQKLRKLAIESRLASLQKTEANRRFLSNQLQRFLGAKFLKPQRVMNLSSKEERHRAEATWMAYDRAMWTMAFAPVEELSELVAKPHQVRENLQDTVLLFSDQVPFWVKVVSSRQLYGKEEFRTIGTKGHTPQPHIATAASVTWMRVSATVSRQPRRGLRGSLSRLGTGSPLSVFRRSTTILMSPKLLRARSASLFWC